MDSNYPKSDELVALIRAWVHQNVTQLNNVVIIDAHLTSILGIHITEKVEGMLIETSLLALHNIIEELKLLSLRESIICLLIIPLTSSKNNLTRKCPISLEEIYSELSNEPPSIYLMKYMYHELAIEWEEYRSSLPFRFPSDNKDLTVFYREYRSSDAIHNDWAYSRDICLLART